MKMKKNNNLFSGSIEAAGEDEQIYSLPELVIDNAAEKLREKFITSQEDDALSENWTEDQEEQNEIHNNLFDNQPIGRKRDIVIPKY